VSKPAFLAIAIAVAVAALVTGVLFQQLRSSGQEADIRPLMAVSFADLEGKSRNLGEWRGKVLVVNFWATWCPPCLKEIPEFIRMQQQLGEQGLQFVGIAADQPEKVRQFAADYRMNYPVLLGQMDVIEIARLAGNTAGGLPFTVIIDREGRWVRSASGALDEARLQTLLGPLLESTKKWDKSG
jgi:thiol-disulfide isomerase/thioredoxin